jgi:iron(III) transport system ATP-binding protein
MANIIFENLSKHFQENTALNNINLKIEPGELIALLGPSGCGKTTLLRLLAGFIAPDQGKILIDEQVISDSNSNYSLPPEKRNMAMIFQSYAVWPHLNVFDNVAFGLRLRKINKQELKNRVTQALCLVHLETMANRYPAQLSGGQQQRVALARAIVVKPQIFLLDEPLSNLDASLREEMRREILHLHRQLNLTSVYVTHDQREALAISDRVVVMSAGKIEQVGTPEEIYEQPKSEFVANFIGRFNLLPAKMISPTEVEVEGLVFRPLNVAEIDLDQEVLLCILPRAIALHPVVDGVETNDLTAKVEEIEYFGEFREYLVRLENNLCLKVITPPNISYPIDAFVHLSIEFCRLIYH